MIKKFFPVLFFLLNFICFGQSFEQTGYCTYYADKLIGRKTSSGEPYNSKLFTAAHRTLPFNTVVLVTNLRNQKKVLVKINDRGPHTKGRILDVSKAAAIELDIIHYGSDKIKLEVVDVPPCYLKQDTTVNLDSLIKAAKPVAVKQSTKPIPVASVNEKNAAPDKKDDIPVLDAARTKDFPDGYGIQMGYFGVLKNCKNFLLKIQAKYGVKGYVYKETKKNGVFYRLIMGDFPNKEQALQAQKKLKNEVAGCFLVNWKHL
ncbi:MAG TPA: septal ring lytic transglycosylase RlpA family protein [Bacteroidales bacterium]|nr:septal ring lytic transglycosylase RlpA family protein [Bacteroidales bacterium]HQI69169.1 septal ring lytic transglycosylase RlpA family protein [Bacteroidales bacterium]